jgi:hypothetical protein
MRFLIISCYLVFSLPLISQPMYVLSKEAKLMSEPSMKSDVVEIVSHGKKVDVSSSKGIWVNISVPDASGWVCKFNLSQDNPLKDSVVGDLSEINKKKKARRRASSYSTSATTRGFTEYDEKISTDSDYTALKLMISYQPSSTKIKAFMDEGGLMQ